MARETSIESYQNVVNSINEKEYQEIIDKKIKGLGGTLEKIGKSMGGIMGTAVQKYASGFFGIGPKLIGTTPIGKVLPLDLEAISNKIAIAEGNIVGKTFGAIYGTQFKFAGDIVTNGFQIVSRFAPSSLTISYDSQRKKIEELAKQIRSMQVECDNLKITIATTIQKDLENSIDDLQKTKKTLTTQKLELGSQDKIKIISNEIDAEIEKLIKLRKINDQLLEKLKKLGTSQIT